MNDSYDEYLNWKKKENSAWNRFSKQIKPVHLIGIFLLILVGQSLVSSGKMTNTLFWGIVVSFVVVFIFLAYRAPLQSQLIPERVIKTIAQRALEQKKKTGEISYDAKVNVMLSGEAHYEQDFISGTSGIVRRDVGFEINRKGYKKKGVIGVHPYSGEILGIRWEPLGYTGKETKDRIIVPANFLKNSEPTQ